MTALNVGDPDLSTGSVMIRQGKGRKPRVTFLGSNRLRMAIKYLRFRGNVGSDSPLWATAESGRLKYAGLRDIIRCE